MLRKHEIRICVIIGAVLFITILVMCTNVNYITLDSIAK